MATTFRLRPWLEFDLPSLVRYANNPKIAGMLSDAFPHPYTEEKAKAFIEMANSSDPVHIFAIDMEGEAIGGMGVHPLQDIHRKNAELGYWIGEPFWGQGIVTQLMPQLVDFAFQNFDINRVFARTFGSNRSSQRVLIKNNFVLESEIREALFKNGEYFDEVIFAIRRSDWALSKVH